MSRFDRDFRLTITTDEGVFTYLPPFRIQFSALKSTDGGLNKMTCKLFGLSEQKRLSLVKDAEQNKRITLEFFVGYQGRLERVFIGNVFRGANSLGDTFETILETYDGGFDFINSYTSKTVIGKQNAINAVIDDMPQTEAGSITIASEIVRPKVLVGSSSELLRQMANEGQDFWIDNNRVNILGKDEVIDDYTPIVTSSTGLLGVPERELEKVTFETLINPFVRIGGLCQLKSKIAPHLNGRYRIFSIGYDGDNEGNTWKQTVTGFLY